MWVDTKAVIHVGAAALSVLIPFNPSDDIPMGFAYHFGIASLHASVLWSPFVKLGLVPRPARLCQGVLSMAITNCMPDTGVPPCANELGLANSQVTETQHHQNQRSCRVFLTLHRRDGRCTRSQGFLFFLSPKFRSPRSTNSPRGLSGGDSVELGIFTIFYQVCMLPSLPKMFGF